MNNLFITILALAGVAVAFVLIVWMMVRLFRPEPSSAPAARMAPAPAQGAATPAPDEATSPRPSLP